MPLPGQRRTCAAYAKSVFAFANFHQVIVYAYIRGIALALLFVSQEAYLPRNENFCVGRATGNEQRRRTRERNFHLLLYLFIGCFVSVCLRCVPSFNRKILSVCEVRISSGGNAPV